VAFVVRQFMLTDSATDAVEVSIAAGARA